MFTLWLNSRILRFWTRFPGIIFIYCGNLLNSIWCWHNKSLKLFNWWKSYVLSALLNNSTIISLNGCWQQFLCFIKFLYCACCAFMYKLCTVVFRFNELPIYHTTRQQFILVVFFVRNLRNLRLMLLKVYDDECTEKEEKRRWHSLT